MLQRLSEGVNRRLAHLFPERRVILRSEESTRYYRISPLLQVSAAALMVGVIGWTGFASVKLAETAFRAAAADERIAATEAAYEARVAALTRKTVETAEALSLAQGEAYLSSDRLAREHETLTNALTNGRELAARLQSARSRLDSLTEEHDAALQLCEATGARVAALEAALADKSREAESRADMLAALNATLDDVVTARDDAAETTQSLTLQIDQLSNEILERAALQDRIFAQLEDAAAASIGSLEDVFEQTGAEMDPILDSLRRDQTGAAGGPFLPADDIEALGASADAERLDSLLSSLERVNLLRTAAEQMPLGKPADSLRYSSRFGLRKDPMNGRRARHEGVDLTGGRGVPIYATGPGKVVYAGWRRGYGKIVEIEHAFGYETRYAHLSRTRVKVGAHVERGDRIGDMGSTGRSTGTHLHYEVRIGGAPVNPVKYIEAARNVL